MANMRMYYEKKLADYPDLVDLITFRKIDRKSVV